MKFILPTVKPFDKLLKKQAVKAGEQYRPMNFVVEQHIEEGLLLFHTMTKALVLLSTEEAKLYKSAPSALPDLIGEWFLVPMKHNDRLLSQQMRHVARMLKQHTQAITSYTILTTTDCNARCFYCFEQGANRISMNSETAQRTADYIIKHSLGQSVSLFWFGGEPLFNKPVITLICERLKEFGIKYKSELITNGYLLNDKIIAEAKELWLLTHVQITLDGTEKVYNRSKAYIYKNVNAYRRVIRNIHKLQEAGINTRIRLNIDIHNAENLKELVKELHQEFSDPQFLSIYLHPLYEYNNNLVAMDDEQKRRTLFKTMQEIRSLLLEYRFINSSVLKLKQKVKTNSCMADNDACITIMPTGDIGKCEHYTNDHFISHIESEVWDKEGQAHFCETRDEIEDCTSCFNYPDCIMLKQCQSTPRCFPELRDDILNRTKIKMTETYKNFRGQDEIQN